MWSIVDKGLEYGLPHPECPTRTMEWKEEWNGKKKKWSIMLRAPSNSIEWTDFFFISFTFPFISFVFPMCCVTIAEHWCWHQHLNEITPWRPLLSTHISAIEFVLFALPVDLCVTTFICLFFSSMPSNQIRVMRFNRTEWKKMNYRKTNHIGNAIRSTPNSIFFSFSQKQFHGPVCFLDWKSKWADFCATQSIRRNVVTSCWNHPQAGTLCGVPLCANAKMN